MNSHFLKKARKTHASYDLAALKDYKTQGYMERREKRVAALSKVQEQVSNDLKAVDNCIIEVLSKAEELITQITHKKEEIMRELQEKRREIEDSMREVMDSLARDKPKLRSLYGELIREQLDNGCNSDFSLFQYSVDTENPQLRLTFDIKKPIPQDQSEFPCISMDKLRLYDHKNKHIQEFSLQTSFTQGTVFCILSPISVLCIGGEPASSSVGLLDVSTREIEIWPGTYVRRAYPGVAKVGESVYVFGSYRPRLASAEKMQICTKTWSGIRDMSEARSCFMPGVHLTNIYLFCLFEAAARGMEVFNTITECYHSVPMHFPFTEECYAHTFIIRDELMVITSTAYIGKWKIQATDPMLVYKIEDKSQEIVKNTYIHLLDQAVPVQEKAMLSNCPAFVVGNEVFLVNYARGALLKVDFEACKVVF